MIGLQCNPQQQRPAAEAGPVPSSAHERRLPQLSAHCHLGAKAAPSRSGPPGSAASSAASSPSPSHSDHSEQHQPQAQAQAQPLPRQQQQQQQQQQQHQQEHGRGQPAHKTRRVSSPGYHSAASSPGGSSVASPVSSSASTTSSSGVSSAASSCARPASSSPGPAAAATSTTGTPPVTMPPAGTPAHSQTGHQAAIGCSTASAQRGQHASHSCASPSPSPLPGARPGAHQQLQQQQQLKHEAGPARPASQSPAGAGLAHLFDHFPGLDPDGLRLGWAHATNSRRALDAALGGRALVVAGDISLAEMSRYPVPIMARPPLGVSDLTLETWLSEVVQSRKGIKLTFTSTRTVEPAFRVLARHAQSIKGPLILSADILTSGGGGGSPARTGSKQLATQQAQQQAAHEQQPVDAWTFLMLCRTRFPRSIISIGWCSAAERAGAPTAAFELDLMQAEQQARQQLAGPPAPHHQHHFSQPLFHLPAAPAGPQRLSSLSVVQQLAAVAAAAAANSGVSGAHTHAHHRQQQQQQHHHHHFMLSSSGSLNSSSGNSSGSPSPTSPVGHLMSPAHQHLLARSLQEQRRPPSVERKPDPAGGARLHTHQQSSQAVGWPAVAAAAMVAASNLRRLDAGGDSRARPEDEFEAGGDDDDEETAADEQEDVEGADERARAEQEPLPLNLNINEADPQHASASALSELAHRIHSLQQQSSNLSSIASSLGKRASPQTTSGGAALALASKLLAGNLHRGWEHVSKKAAFAHQPNADSPSPVPTSPKQSHQQQQHLQSHLQHAGYQQQQQSGNLLCVKPHHSLANLALASQTHVGGPGASPLRPQGAAQAACEPGYTREMIDKMASLVKEYNLTQAITFPVEARLALRNNSLAELQRLLYQVGAHATLTIVAQQEDLIGVEDLLTIRRHFAAQQLLFDLPEGLAAALRRALDR